MPSSLTLFFLTQHVKLAASYLQTKNNQASASLTAYLLVNSTTRLKMLIVAESIYTELLLVVLKPLDLEDFYNLSHSSSIFRIFLKAHARELCNNTVDIKIKEVGDNGVFTITQNSQQEWICPDCQVITSAAFIKETRLHIPEDLIDYRTAREIERLGLSNLVDLKGPQFACLLENQAYHIQYYAN